MPITPLDLGKFSNQLGGYAASTAPAGDLTKLISNVLAIITIIAGASFLFYFIFGAVNWITSGGDPQKAAAARNTILNAVIGLIITVIAYPAILLVSNLLGVPLLKPEELFGALFQ